MSKLACVLAVTTLIGCGEVVEIPPAHVGKLSTPKGLQKGLIPPSKIRLDMFCMVCDSIILVESSDYPVVEQMKIFMPKDKLNLLVDVRGVFQVSNESSNVEKVFARISAKPISYRVSKIAIETVYGTYAKPVVREVTRSVVTKHSIMEVMRNREAISAELTKEVRKKLSPTPITAIQFGLANTQPPEVIVTAQEAAKKREIEIREAEADKLVRLKVAESDLEVAIKQQEVDLKEAETQVKVNKKLASGVTSAFVQQRALKVLEVLAKNPNNKVFYFSEATLKNPASIIGASFRGSK